MPDYDPNSDWARYYAQAGGAPQGGTYGGGFTAQNSPNQFINFDRYLAANSTGAANDAAKIAGQVDQTGAAAQNALAAAKTSTPAGQTYNQAHAGLGDQLDAAGSQAHQAGTPEGLAALYQQTYGGANAGFGAALAGASGGDRFASLAQKYGGLSHALGDVTVPADAAAGAGASTAAGHPSANKWNDENFELRHQTAASHISRAKGREADGDPSYYAAYGPRSAQQEGLDEHARYLEEANRWIADLPPEEQRQYAQMSDEDKVKVGIMRDQPGRIG